MQYIQNSISRPRKRAGGHSQRTIGSGRTHVAGAPVAASFAGNRAQLIMQITLVLAALVVYLPILGNDFINFDDPFAVEDKAKEASLAQVLDEFSHPFAMPLRSLALVLINAVGGIDPRYYHAASMTIHGLSSVLLFHVVLLWLRALGPPEVRSQPPWTAFLTAMLFLVHPINVEAVAWATCLKDNLMALFSFLTMLFFHKSVSGKRALNISYFVMAVVTAALAVFSKPVAIVLPAVCLGYYFLIPEESSFFDRLYSIRYALIVLLLGFLGFYLIYANSFALFLFPSRQEYLTRVYSILYAVFVYTRNYMLPFWLTIRYPDEIITSFFQSPKVWIGLLELVFLVFFLTRAWVRKEPGARIMFWGLIWFGCFWAPTSNIIPISTTVADRYVYLAGVGLFFPFSYRVVGSLGHTSGTLKTLGKASLALYLAGLAILAHHQSLLWRNDYTLWTDSLSKNPDNWIAHNNLGHYLFVKDDFQNALAQIEMAHKLVPGRLEPIRNARMIYIKAKEYEAARTFALEVVKREPVPLVSDLYELGIACVGSGRYEEGIHWLLDALEKDSQSELILKNIVDAYMKSSDLENAYAYLSRLLERKPTDLELLERIAPVAARIGRHEEAARFYGTIQTFKPQDSAVRLNLMALASIRNDHDRVVTLADEVLPLLLIDFTKEGRDRYFLAISYKFNALLAERKYDEALDTLTYAREHAVKIGDSGEMDNLDRHIETLQREFPSMPESTLESTQQGPTGSDNSHWRNKTHR